MEAAKEEDEDDEDDEESLASSILRLLPPLPLPAEQFELFACSSSWDRNVCDTVPPEI
jgi:hypothetical protein